MSNELDDLVFKSLSLAGNNKIEEARVIVQSILDNNLMLEKLNSNHWQFIGDVYLILGDFNSAKSAYEKSSNNASLAFTLILLKNFDEAREILEKTSESPASKWCNFLVLLFKNEIKKNHLPTFLQIRHFLEFTVYYLLLSKNNLILKLLVKNLNKLTDINVASAKLIGSAYLNMGYIDEAISFLLKSIKIDSFDGEGYFLLGKAYFLKKDFKNSVSALSKAELFLPQHIPTKELMLKARQLFNITKI